MKIVAISDTHSYHREVTIPDGDVLVFAGDLSRGAGTPQEIKDFNTWLGELPHKHKIMIPGNHDFPFQTMPSMAPYLITKADLLIDQEIVIDGVKFYGSPWQPWFHDWAYNLDRGEPLREKWAKIPDDTDVLITHGPPHGILDVVRRGGMNVGCEDLAKRVVEIAPKVHIFGHIHESYGQLDFGGTLYVNASICTLWHEPTNPPVIIDI